MEDVIREIRIRGASQQPEWSDLLQLSRVGEALAARPSLIQPDDLPTLRTLLGKVALGEAMVLQTGDCAEDPRECTRDHVARKTALLDVLAGTLGLITGKPVLRAGRIAGQFAKPRSKPTELVGGVELPVFRGHMVNGPEPEQESRRPDALRILTGYMAACDIVEHLGWRDRAAGRDVVSPLVWTSHEALLLDYEMPMLRTDDKGRLYLGSTHWPWIGERTRQVEGAHVALLAEVANPVACKVGPTMEPDELLALCERLDPWRDPGRLTLIARMGADVVADRLPRLVEAVRGAGHPVVWLSDPVHGNTITAPGGHKTRLVETVSLEVSRFVEAVRGAGGVAGGLHLETTPDDVTECAVTEADLGSVGERYTSYCDPRLNPSQAVSVVRSWTA
ncbi:3-deoxy-7-phosphoheptulonate synthase [Streptomyces sp. NL15-2K]|uniref:3-deoxy-7-phosphoheptulonate synthase n=1 Tax=Streptomyces sp. NL15-2K TaxID=376149 RepID=UPI000F58437C|nr:MULTISPECIES: 3-deoxy-7-phosphoheptulonate synthase [Actinomycetes]WKX13928.1 3-deoxy-7-phosphoheptulonate synthase [Kutzneria buriramensis]GCB50885.1 2-keto-3-deoxy-D-arabino-heptulosonate-7-phosphate synthase II [Streptomyces sp. NL15-2K]